jgi:hypothetical protein
MVELVEGLIVARLFVGVALQPAVRTTAASVRSIKVGFMRLNILPSATNLTSRAIRQTADRVAKYISSALELR